MASLPWSIFQFSGDTGDTPGWTHLDQLLTARLQHMEPVLAGRDWAAGAFAIADIAMADVLRLVDRFDGLAGFPACRDYVVRATARPAFLKAHADQMAHFAAADRVALHVRNGSICAGRCHHGNNRKRRTVVLGPAPPNDRLNRAIELFSHRSTRAY